jgi:hypothetical protein
MVNHGKGLTHDHVVKEATQLVFAIRVDRPDTGAEGACLRDGVFLLSSIHLAVWHPRHGHSKA